MQLSPNLDPIDKMRYYLTLQLEAYYKNDWQKHDEIGQIIDQLAKEI